MSVKAGLYGGIAACILLSFGQAALAVENAGALQGVVTDASGKAVAGAYVRVHNTDRERDMTFMVVSKNGGLFAANDLPAGNYTAQAVGGDFQSKESPPLTVGTGQSTKINLSLADKRGPMLAAAWPDMLPGHVIAKPESITLPEGAGKHLVEEKCTVCHNTVRIAYSRHDRDGWQQLVTRMRRNLQNASLPDISDADANTILDYVTKNFGALPQDANSRLPRELATGDARNYRVVTYRATKYAGPHDIAVDPTGVAWAAVNGGQLIRFDLNTLDIGAVYAPPGSVSPANRSVGNPTITNDGVLWAMDKPNARWLSYDIKKAKWTAFYLPKGKIAQGNTMVQAPDGTVWASNLRDGAYSLNPATGEWKFYRSKLGNIGGYGLAVAGDGSVWFAENRGDRMGHIDPKTGTMEDLPIPVSGLIWPRRMDADAAGNLWVGLWQPGQLLKVDYKTKKMMVYTPPTKDAGTYSVGVDKKNNIIWVSEQEADKIARFDPKTETWLEFPLPYSQTDPRRIGVDPTNPNRVIFSGARSDLIGFVEYMPEKLRANR